MGTLRISHTDAAAVAREHLAAAEEVVGLAESRPWVGHGGAGSERIEALLSACCVPAGDLAATHDLLAVHVLDVAETFRVVDEHFGDAMNTGDLVP